MTMETLPEKKREEPVREQVTIMKKREVWEQVTIERIKRDPILQRMRATRGLATKIAEGLAISRGSVSRWTHIPAERIVDIERITGIPREELRPDLYRHKT